MAEGQGTLRDKLTVAFIDTLVFGALLLVGGFWLNMRLESYKQELAEQAEGVKALMQHYAPVMQQREAAYLEIRQAARVVVINVEHYYFSPQKPIIRPYATQKVRGLGYDIKLGSGSTGGGIPEKENVVQALWTMASLIDKYNDILSETVRVAVDEFFDTVMDDVRKAEQAENQTEAFKVAGHARLRESFGQLNNAIHRALRLDELPIK